MAIRGRLDHDRAGPLNYEVVQWKFVDRDRVYVRGATSEKLDSSSIEWVRIKVTPEDNPDDHAKYMTLWGPYLSVDIIESEIDVAFDDDPYLEAIGA